MTYETVAEAIRRIAGEYPEGTKIIYVLTGLKSDPVGYYLEGELNFCCTMTSWGPALSCDQNYGLVMDCDHRLYLAFLIILFLQSRGHSPGAE